MTKLDSDRFDAMGAGAANTLYGGDDAEALERLAKAKCQQDMVEFGFAHVMYERLVAQIEDFQNSVGPDEEVAAHLSSFETQLIVLIDTVGFQPPHFVILNGVDAATGERVRLIQHTSQTSVLLVASKVTAGREPHRIRFYDQAPHPTDD